MNKTTNELLKTLKHNNLKTYLSDNKDEFVASSLSEALNQMLLLKNLSKAEVIEKANIFNVYGYQIFSGQKTPSRDKLISLFSVMIPVIKRHSLSLLLVFLYKSKNL